MVVDVPTCRNVTIVTSTVPPVPFATVVSCTIEIVPCTVAGTIAPPMKNTPQLVVKERVKAANATEMIDLAGRCFIESIPIVSFLRLSSPALYDSSLPWCFPTLCCARAVVYKLRCQGMGASLATRVSSNSPIPNKLAEIAVGKHSLRPYAMSSFRILTLGRSRLTCIEGSTGQSHASTLWDGWISCDTKSASWCAYRF